MWRTRSTTTIIHYQANGGITIDRPSCLIAGTFEIPWKANRSSEGWWDHCTYYTDPEIYYAERRLTNRPDCFKALNLPADASTAEIKAAFRRLSRATHPDAGGKAEEFVRVRRCYEEAMAIASRTDGADDA